MFYAILLADCLIEDILQAEVDTLHLESALDLDRCSSVSTFKLQASPL